MARGAIKELVVVLTSVRDNRVMERWPFTVTTDLTDPEYVLKYVALNAEYA